MWEYRRQIPEDLVDYIPATTTNRALAIHGNSILYTSNDDYMVALDAQDGSLQWQTRILDYRVNPAQQSSGPIVIQGKAVSGRGCMPVGGPETCVITAHDVQDGSESWRLNTIQRPGEGDVDTWGGMPWEDRWHVVDHWDLDHPFERLLVDTRLAPDPAQVSWINPAIETGREYRVMTGIPGKTGVVYTLDRESGEFLWARPTVHQTVVADIDGTSLSLVTTGGGLVFGGDINGMFRALDQHRG
ncbi:MAG: PQQ-binding-like beta-propeller repeat protein, partial [Pseudohongiellaceae bacterium]